MLCEPDPKLYHFVAQGMITIDNVDDAEEMKATDVAFDVLNFSQVNIRLLLLIYFRINCFSEISFYFDFPLFYLNSLIVAREA